MSGKKVKAQAKEKEPCVCGHMESEHDTPTGTCKFEGEKPDDCKCVGFEEEEAS
jgi:hypothetical protein